MHMTRTNVHLYPSPFTHETRILRITASLVAHGTFDRVIVVAALRTPGTAERERLDDAREVWRVRTVVPRLGLLTKALNSIEWSLRVLWGLRREQINCLNPHALSVLPLAVIIKLFKSCRVIYDAHEIETETTEVTGLRKPLSQLTERLLISFVDAVNLTSDGHGAWYRREYGLDNVWVVRNCPYRRTAVARPPSDFREKFGIPDDHLVFIYQGAIAAPRGTDLLLDVFVGLPPDRHIVFMGFGPGVDRVREHEQRLTNIHYCPAVPPAEVSRYTCGANVGIHVMDDSCVNHLHALPNKPMEYMNAGLPAIVSDLPEMGELIRSAGAGWVVPVNDGAALRRMVLGLDWEQIEAKRRLAQAWADSNNWESEEPKLTELYRTLGFPGREH
jgi:glycosyltransferase involved in cell wall biosynthesis